MNETIYGINFVKKLYLDEMDKKLGGIVDEATLYSTDSRDKNKGFAAITYVLKMVEKDWGEEAVEHLINKHGLRSHGFD